MNIFVFDIETIPDVHLGRKILGLHDLSDEEVAEAMFLTQREKSGSDFLRLHCHQVVAISVAFRHRDTFKVWSLAEEKAPEKDLVERFFKGIEKYKPILVSWNGTGFDLPVLHYRALMHGISCPTYWETGDFDSSFKWNNYLNRYHSRHLDLMDSLACYQARANAPLDEIALSLGLPGKMGMSGSKVWQSYLDGDQKGIRDYCETDVLNTYLVYLRFEFIRGKLTPEEYQDELDRVAAYLEEQEQPHFHEFLHQWHSS